MSRVSRRSLVSRLEALRVDEPMNDVFADDLAARLQSLAIAASFEVGANKGRLRRKLVAAVGSIGVIGWIGVTGAAASVGLATTGNLPAPIQDVVSTVFDVVGIDIPASNDEPDSNEDPAPIEGDGDSVDASVPSDDSNPEASSDSTPESTPESDDDIVLVDPSVPAIDVDEDNPVSSSRPGNSGSTPSVTAPGQSGQDDDKADDDKDNPSNTAPGQVGKDDDEDDDKADDVKDNPSNTAPGQVGKDDDEKDDKATPPGQESRDEEKPTPPGQDKNDKGVKAKESDDDPSTSPNKKDKD